MLGAHSTDVVVIGAGFTGLAAALHLSRAGVNVTVLEAAEPGWGASGRNNGQVIPTLSRADPEAIIARHRLVGERFVGLIRDSAQGLFDTIATEKIDAEAEQTGWVQPVHSAGRMRLAEARVAEWTKAGAKVALLSKDEMARKLGTHAWHGGWWVPSGGHINPLALARGLARVVVAKGGMIHCNTPVLGFGRAGARWVVTTPVGRIDARALILATNACTDMFAPRLAPRIAHEMVPVTSWQLATPPVPDAIRNIVLPGRHAVSDTRQELRFMRYDARNRLVTGGAIVGQRNGAEKIKRALAQRLVATFPELAGMAGGVTFDYVWNGPIGATRDGLPHLHMLGPDGYTWAGCNGRGVAMAMAIGAEFARGILGVPRSELALPFSEPAPIPLHRIVRHLAPLRLLSARRDDARELAG